MKSGVLSLILIGATSLVSNAEETTDSFLRTIAAKVDTTLNPISEKEALGYLQQMIDGAKKKVAEHKVPDPEVLKRLLSSNGLDANIIIGWSDGCTANECLPLRMTRSGESLTFRLGYKDKAKELSFSLASKDLTDQSAQALFREFNTHIEKLAVAPSESQWIAESAPEKLLSRGRENRQLIGGSGFIVVSVTLKDPAGELKLANRDGWCFEEMKSWYDAVTKLLSAPQVER